MQDATAAATRMESEEPYALMARLMYGAGLRQTECCRLRMKDVDVDVGRGQLTVRGGKGDKDRFVMLPQVILNPPHPRPLSREGRGEQEASTYQAGGILQPMEWRRAYHERDLARGFGRVEMPTALAIEKRDATVCC